MRNVNNKQSCEVDLAHHTVAGVGNTCHPTEVPRGTEGVGEKRQQSNQSRPAYLLVQVRGMRQRRRPRGPPRPSGTGPGPAGGRDGPPDNDREAAHGAERGHIPNAQGDETSTVRGRGVQESHGRHKAGGAGGEGRGNPHAEGACTTTRTSMQGRRKQHSCLASCSQGDGQISKQGTSEW